MKRVKRKALLAITFIFYISSCSAQDIGFQEMKNAENIFNEHQNNKPLIESSLEELFPDQQIRALLRSVSVGEFLKVDELVTQGVDVNYLGVNGVPPLYWIMKVGNLEGFEKLLELGADSNIIFNDTSVLHLAARLRDTEFLRLSLLYGANANLVAGQFAETPIFETIGILDSYNKEAMLLLLNSGANINATTSGKIFGMSAGGKTPIMSAAEFARFDIVFDLLELGADYNLTDDQGKNLDDRVLSMQDAFIPGSDSDDFLKKVIGWLNSNKGRPL